MRTDPHNSIWRFTPIRPAAVSGLTDPPLLFTDKHRGGGHAGQGTKWGVITAQISCWDRRSARVLPWDCIWLLGVIHTSRAPFYISMSYSCYVFIVNQRCWIYWFGLTELCGAGNFRTPWVSLRQTFISLHWNLELIWYLTVSEIQTFPILLQ